jgi:eukaryotic-like serine/threonine-protein kinase
VRDTPPKDPGPKEPKDPTLMEPAASTFGKLWIGAKPQCSIFIDGRDTGRTTPVRDLDVKPGSVTVMLVNNEFGIREKFTVTVKAGETVKLIKDYSDRIKE